METPLTTKKRNSNLELFRIITMLLIVAHHYVVNSGLTWPGPVSAAPDAPRSIALLLFGAWGKIGINCFVMITGYFMCRSEITVTKFLKLLLEVMFYRFAIYSIFWLCGYSPFPPENWLKLLIPVTNINKGFIGAFLMFYLCIPFLNILIRHLTQKQHLCLVGLLSLLYIIPGTFKNTFNVNFNYVSWFCVIYFIASYIRIYPYNLFDRTKLWGICTVFLILLCATSVIYYAFCSVRTSKYAPYFAVTDSNTLLAVLTAVSAFLFFKNLKIKYNPFINTVASGCFGVLLIHAHSDTMRKWLWKDLLDNVGHYKSDWLPVHAIGSVLAIYIICTIIDCLRIQFLEKPLFKWWNKHYPKIAEKCNGLAAKLSNKLYKA